MKPFSKPGLMARIIDASIGAYQWLGSVSEPRCRYLPTCSEYAREAVSSAGALRGSWLAVQRVARCRPGGGHGYDPVPTPVRRDDRGSSNAPMMQGVSSWNR